MNNLIEQWKRDERATFRGWDFSHLKGRWQEEEPAWNYIAMAKNLVRKSSSVLDMGTGGGEIFSKLSPFPKETYATEGYKPNVIVARKRLRPLGVKVVDVSKLGLKLPFHDSKFDIVIDRHEAFNAKEVFRVLKPEGIFLTQQVGGGNLSDLVKAFGTKSKYKNWSLNSIMKDLKLTGFQIKLAKQWKGKVEFKDVGAVVYFLKSVPWCVPAFSVRRNWRHLEKLQKRLNAGKHLTFREVRYITLAKKLLQQKLQE